MGRIFRDADGPVLAPRGSVVAIGAFDGVHRGHAALLARARERAQALGVEAIALSFEPLPRQFFQPALPRLTPPRAKLARLLDAVDRVGLLRFDAALAAMSPEAFVARVLVARLRAQEVWVGPEFRFGHRRAGDLSTLMALGAAHGFQAHELPAVQTDGQRASASTIRHALAAGDLEAAARALGRPYSMCGHVVRGAQLGRRLGYPTANLRVRFGAPALTGIFAARVDGAGLRGHPAVASLGTRPTVDGVEPLLEAHLFEFDGDLYGRLLEVHFVAKLREELRFEGLDALVDQIHRDAAQARAILDPAPRRVGAPT